MSKAPETVQVPHPTMGESGKNNLKLGVSSYRNLYYSILSNLF